MTRHAAFALASALALGACESPTGPTEGRPEDYPPIRTVVLEGSFGLEPLASKRFDFRMPESAGEGVMYVFATIDWTDPANNVVASFAGEGCEGVNTALAGRCSIERAGTSPSLCHEKPRTFTETVGAGVAVSLYVANAGTSLESGRVRIVTCQEASDCQGRDACFQCSSESQDRTSCRGG